MLSARSTHKRKRSARRGDDARDQKASGRAILTLGGASGEGNDSSNAMIESSWAWKRLERDLAAHPFNHRVSKVDLCLWEEALLQKLMRFFLLSTAASIIVPSARE